jgi:radical SAM superfamily enzyme YgiQ (UPF0313 family)
MKVLFILPSEKSKYFELDYHHGIAQLSSCLKEDGHKTELKVLSSFNPKTIDDTIKKSKPDLLAYSFTSDHAVLAKQVMNHTKHYGITTLAGGVHATMAPADIIAHCDAVCIGEGEQALRDVANGKSVEEIPNLWVHRDGTVIKNNTRPFLQNLDALPFSDRALFDYQKSLDQDHRADFMAGRGCPFHCSYCVNDKLKKVARGNYVRWHSPGYMIKEIKSVLENYDRIESICFQDDTFAMNVSWLDEFASIYKQQIGMPFVCNLRVGSINKQIVDLLSEAGCIEARIGIEQGNEELRHHMLRRKMDNQKIIQTVDMVKKAGIQVFAYNMVGIPGETRETIQETIALNRQIKPDKLHVSMFRPYPGTALYDYCVQNDLFSSKTTSSYFEPIATVQLPTISTSELEYYFRIFRVAVTYPRLTPIASVLAKIKLGKQTRLYDILFETALSVYFFTRAKLPNWIKKPIFKKFKA